MNTQMTLVNDYFDSVDTDSINVNLAVRKFCREYPDFDWSCGASRVAFWYKDWDFVIKIPRDDEEKDYCEIEVKHYESAKRYGVERICLPIELMRTFDNGIKFYKQTRYTCDTATAIYKKGYSKYLNNRSCTGNHKIVDKVYHDCIWINRADRYWVERVIQLYGKKFTHSMEAWLTENKINDLHDRNTGWLNNRPILLDYAGYHS